MPDNNLYGPTLTLDQLKEFRVDDTYEDTVRRVKDAVQNYNPFANTPINPFAPCDPVIGPVVALSTLKQTNPKDQIASDKLPLHLWPQSATAYGCIGLLNGMLKYGRTNWREAGIRPSIYIDACIRHLTDWFEGEDYDPEDGVHNLSAALACLAILVDSIETGNMNDDRNFNGQSYRKARAKMEKHVKRLKEFHQHRNPKHYTVKDNPSGTGNS